MNVEILTLATNCVLTLKGHSLVVAILGSRLQVMRQVALVSISYVGYECFFSVFTMTSPALSNDTIFVLQWTLVLAVA